MANKSKRISELPALSVATLDTTYVVGISGSTTYKISINNLTSSLDAAFATDLVTAALSSSLDGKLSTSSFNSYTASFSASVINTGSFATTGSNLFRGDQTITGSLFINGTTELGGNIVPKSAKGGTLGTSERPFADIYVSSGSINIASDIPGDPNTTLTNIGGNILISAGGMRLVGGASFIAVTGSFQYISGSMTQVGNYSQTGNYTMVGNKIITGSLEISGSAKVNGNNVITEIKNTFNPQFTDSSGSFAGGVQTGHYTLMNDLCFFRIFIDFATTTNFGNSQYQITLPFPTIATTTIRGGTLHQLSGGGTLYNITGVTTGSSATLPLFYTGTTSYLNWKFNTPVSASTTSSHFDMNGVYEIA
jgi:hypothetical protein